MRRQGRHVVYSMYIYKHKASHVHVLQVTGLHKSTKIKKFV